MSPLPSELPKLPKWPFFALDVLLLAVAAYIAWQSPSHLPPASVFSIAGCVGLAAVLCMIPFVVTYSRKHDEALDERQRSLEALSKIIQSSAEQVGIAAQGIGTLSEGLHKMLRQAEHLPQKIHDRMAELQLKLGEVQQAAAVARTDEIDELERELAALRSSEVERFELALEKTAGLVTELRETQETLRKALSEQTLQLASLAKPIEAERVQAPAPRKQQTTSGVGQENIPVQKPIPPAPDVGMTPPAFIGETKQAGPGGSDTPLPPLEPVVAASPSVAPAPVPSVPVEPELSAAPSPTPAVLPVAAPAPSTPAIPRKSRTKSAQPDDNLDLFSQDLSFEDAMSSQEQSPVSRSLSSDGAARLLVTAYIGIGNKLYIRGEGPGLSLDVGTPLEFISIGKWRWQRSDLSGPVKLRLLKNDRTECPGLGLLVVEPGHQTEVVAKF